MRKRIVGRDTRPSARYEGLDLERVAEVEVTSEDSIHPIEAALTSQDGAGWRAEQPGPQTVRLLFDRPQSIHHIHLVFEERERARTQEFVLRWSADRKSYHQLLRQQYTFSPPGTFQEVEDYTTNLQEVSALELSIVPDIRGGDAVSSLRQFSVG